MPDLPPNTIRAGNKFQVRLIVPKKLRARVGKSIVSVMLDTDSMKEAKRLHPFALAKLRAILDRAEDRPMDALTRAMDIARLLGPIDAPDEDALRRERQKGVPGYALVESGLAVPLTAHRDEWLKTYRDRTRLKREQAMTVLMAWLKSKGLPLLFETVDRKTAFRFRDEGLAKRHPETANSLLSGLRGYWAWAIDRDRIEGENPWKAVKSFPKRRGKSDQQRAFRDEELAALFGPNKHVLRKRLLPIMSLALHSGARLSELCNLRVKDIVYGQTLKNRCDDLEIRFDDCPHGAFFFRVSEDMGKTLSAERITPIHSAVSGIVAKLIDGRAPNDLLFRDNRIKRKGSKDRPFSFSLSQRFERYRKFCKVHDKEGDRTRSRVTFHSFRHNFIDGRTRALADGAAGFNHWVLADVVGHSKGSMPLAMTAENYSGPSSLKARVACVEAMAGLSVIRK